MFKYSKYVLYNDRWGPGQPLLGKPTRQEFYVKLQ